MYSEHVYRRGIILSGAGLLMVIISAGIIGTALLIHFYSRPELIIQLSEKSLRIPVTGIEGAVTYNAIANYSGSEDYVILLQIIGYTPGGYTINSTILLSKGFHRYCSMIDLKHFIRRWEDYYRKHSPYSFSLLGKDMPLPSITDLLITYLSNGKILVGADEIDSYKLLLMMGYTPERARKILMHDPLYPFRHRIIWRLNMKLTPIDIDGIVKNITGLVERIAGQSLSGAEAPKPTGYQGVYTRVWLKQLYDARNDPPESWFSHIVDVNGNPAPRSVVDNAWYEFATRFSQEYIFDKSSWRLLDALRFVFLGQGYKDYDKKPAAITTMTGLIHLLYSGAYGYHWVAAPVNETVVVPILYITASYNLPKQQELYITFTGGVTKTKSTVRLMGLSIFGYIVGATMYSSYIKNCGIDIDCGKPSRAIVAPLHLSNLNNGLNGYPDDLVVLTADVLCEGGQWVIKPLVMILPYLTTIDIKYDMMKPVTCNYGAPENYDKVVWSSYLETVYSNYVTRNSGDPFYTLMFTSNNPSLTCYSGSIIGYYFPLIGETLKEIGLVGKAAETIGELMSIAETTASSDPLVAVALFMAELIGNSINIALYSANGSQVITIVYCDQHILEDRVQIPINIKVRRGYAASGPIYKPLLIEIDINVGYMNAPPGAENLNTNTTRAP